MPKSIQYEYGINFESYLLICGYIFLYQFRKYPFADKNNHNNVTTKLIENLFLVK